ncbi:hypothetical protein COOONC_08008 [Cooperia oncophora]
MDGHSPPPESNAPPDQSVRYTPPRAVDVSDVNPSRVAAESSQVVLSVPEDEVSPMDTSEDVPTDPSVGLTEPSAPVLLISGATDGDQCRPSTPAPSTSAASAAADAASPTTPLSAAVTPPSPPVELAGGDVTEQGMAHMTLSMENLAVEDLAPREAQPSAAPLPSAPPAKARRSASGRRQAPVASRAPAPAPAPARANVVRQFLPMHPEEGMLPLAVFKITAPEVAWFADRLGRFDNYHADPDASKIKLAKICNAACSALAAVNSAEDDRRSHWVVARETTPTWFPMRLQFTLTDMSSEAGWTSGRHVVLWVAGSDSLIRVKVARVDTHPTQHTLHVVVQAFPWSQQPLTRAMHDLGRNVGEIRVVDICVRLSKSTAAANPVYEIVSRELMLSDLSPDTVGSRIIDIVFANMQFGTSDERYLRDLPPPSDTDRSFRVSGRRITLTRDQKDAVRVGTGNLPIVALQAAFGTGKTLVGKAIDHCLVEDIVKVTSKISIEKRRMFLEVVYVDL